MKKIACGLTLVALGLSVACSSNDTSDSTITLSKLGTYTAVSDFDESAAEIVAFNPIAKKIYVVNANEGRVDILDASNPENPSLLGQLDSSDQWSNAGSINSVAYHDGLLAVAVQNTNKQSNGRVLFYDATNESYVSYVEVGALPDMVTFSPDGKTAIVACEGEPNDDYSIDPVGSIVLIDVNDSSAPIATTLGFEDFNEGGSRASELPEGVRIFGNYDRTELDVTDFTTNTVTVSDATAVVAGQWLTISSSFDGDDVEPLPYRIESVDSASGVITLSEDLDDEATAPTGAEASDLTLYLHDGQSSVAQDLEPEYVAVSPDGTTAWVTLQENNAVAVVDIVNKKISSILALGTKDHNLAGNELDVSDKDDEVNIRNYPVKGMYMPDAITSFEQDGSTYMITANEGDARAYEGFVEELRFRDAALESTIFDPLNATLGDNLDFSTKKGVGRLLTTLTNDTDGDGDLDTAMVYGARSFTIWNSDGGIVFDSGSDFEDITAEKLGFEGGFNASNSKIKSDDRSDAKGPEPEAVTTGLIDGRTYAFIGLERVGGIMVYDVTVPAKSTFVEYFFTRDFSAENIEEAGDLGPEGLVFVPADQTTNGKPWLIVGNEVSGTTNIIEIDIVK